MGEPIWSRKFAADLAQGLGYAAPENGRPESAAAEKLVQEIAEAFRYLPADKIRTTQNFARLVHADQAAPALNLPQMCAQQLVAELQSVRDLAWFLKEEYGTAEPADEDDAWTEEDARDLTAATMKHADAKDPYPWDEESTDAQAG